MSANPIPPTPELTFKTEKNVDEATVFVSGRVTSTTSGLLQAKIRGLVPETKRIVLDLTHLNYIDSSGIGALVALYFAASRAQCDFKVVNAQPRIRDLFEITKLSAVFENQGGHGEDSNQ